MISKIVLILAVLAISSASAAKKYEVVYRGDGVVHVSINILENDILELQKETIFRRIAPLVCEAPPCDVRFWLDKSLAANDENMTPKQKNAMVAEYLVTESGLEMIYHYRISKADDIVSSAVCLKEVFNTYCLGGDANALADPISIDASGSVEKRIYPEATIVTSFKGKVASVTRMYDSMTWLQFSSLRSKLEGIYGEPNDFSYYPSYVDSPESKSTAIAVGEAKASLEWPQEGWTLSLMWFKDAAGILYEHDDLKRMMDAMSEDEGF